MPHLTGVVRAARRPGDRALHRSRGSTELRRLSWGSGPGANAYENHHAVRRQLARYRRRIEIDTAGEDSSRVRWPGSGDRLRLRNRRRRRRARPRCPRRLAYGRVRVPGGQDCRNSRSRSGPASPGLAGPARCWSRGRSRTWSPARDRVRRAWGITSSKVVSAGSWTRTSNPPVNSRMLCQLSYRGRQPAGL